MIDCNQLKLLFAWNFQNKVVLAFSLTFFGTAKLKYVIEIREMFSFLPLINSFVAIGLSFLLLVISTITSSKNIKTCYIVM